MSMLVAFGVAPVSTRRTSLEGDGNFDLGVGSLGRQIISLL